MYIDIYTYASLELEVWVKPDENVEKWTIVCACGLTRIWRECELVNSSMSMLTYNVSLFRNDAIFNIPLQIWRVIIVIWSLVIVWKLQCKKKTHTFQVSGIVDQIIKYGKVTRPVLGISFAPEQSVEQLGVSGVLVLDAPPSGPAGKAVWIFCFAFSMDKCLRKL